MADELWDDVIDCMMLRVRDKVPVIRTFAVRSLSRFVNDPENSDILDLLLEVLPLEQNPVKFLSCTVFGLLSKSGHNSYILNHIFNIVIMPAKVLLLRFLMFPGGTQNNCSISASFKCNHPSNYRLHARC